MIKFICSSLLFLGLLQPLSAAIVPIPVYSVVVDASLPILTQEAASGSKPKLSDGFGGATPVGTSFTIALSAQPNASVTVPLSSSDTSEGNVSPSSLVFTSNNWNTPQTVTVSGVNDAFRDGDQAYIVRINALSSSDNRYNGVNPADLPAINEDDEAPSDSGQVSRVGSWLLGLNHTLEYGDDSVLLFVAQSENTEANLRTVRLSSVSYGGQAMILVGEAYRPYRNKGGYTAVFMLKHKDLVQISGSNFVTNWSAAAPSKVAYNSAFFAHVNQQQPIADQTTDYEFNNPLISSDLMTKPGDLLLLAATTKQVFNTIQANYIADSPLVEVYEGQPSEMNNTDAMIATAVATDTVSNLSATHYLGATPTGEDQTLVSLALNYSDGSALTSIVKPVEELGKWRSELLHAPQGGSDRLLVFTAHARQGNNASTGCTDSGVISLNSVQYGGQAMTKIVSERANSNNNRTAYTAMFVLNEAGINAATHGKFIVSWSQQACFPPVYASRFFQHVDQNQPIGNTVKAQRFNGNPIPQSPLALPTQKGDRVLMASTLAVRTLSFYGPENTQQPGEGFQSGVVVPVQQFSGSQDLEASVASKAASGFNEYPEISYIGPESNPSQLGHTLVAAVIQAKRSAIISSLPVVMLGSWSQGLNHSQVAGNNRQLVFTVLAKAKKNNFSTIDISSVRYGGVLMTQQFERFQAAGFGSGLSGVYSSVFTLNEAGLAQAQGSTFTLNGAPNPNASASTYTYEYSSVFLGNTDQSNPVIDTVSEGVQGGIFPLFTPELATDLGGMALLNGVYGAQFPNSYIPLAGYNYPPTNDVYMMSGKAIVGSVNTDGNNLAVEFQLSSGGSADGQLISAIAFASAAVFSISDVNFDDPGLEACVLSQFTPATLLANINTLNCSAGYGIESVMALQDFTALTTLDLSNNAIDDLSGVFMLPNLSDVTASNNQLSALPHAMAAPLAIIDISNNSLTDISGLALAHYAQLINVASNRITDIDALIALATTNAGLSLIDLSGNRPIACSKLNALEAVLQSNGQSAALSRPGACHDGVINTLSDVFSVNDPLGSCMFTNPANGLLPSTPLTSVTYLFCSNRNIQSLEGIQYLTNVTDLDLKGNLIRDLSPTRRLNLTSLLLSSNPIEVLPDSVDWNLSVFSCRNCTELQEVSVLQSMPLRELRLNLSAVRNLAFLSGISSLSDLDISDNAITDISAVTASLGSLVMNGYSLNPGSNLSNQLATLTQLRSLSFNNGYLPNLNALSAMSKLVVLEANNSQVNNIDAIASHRSTLNDIKLNNNSLPAYRALNSLALLQSPNISIQAANSNITGIYALIALADRGQLAFSDVTGNPIAAAQLSALLVRYNDFNPSTLPPLTVSSTDIDNLTFADPNLHLCILSSYIGTPVDQVTSLNCANRSITNLAGIEQLVNLETIILDNNQLTQLMGIPNCGGNCLGGSSTEMGLPTLMFLDTLSIANNNLTDASQLADPLDGVTTIDLSNNTNLTSIDGFAEDVSLLALDFSNDDRLLCSDLSALRLAQPTNNAILYPSTCQLPAPTLQVCTLDLPAPYEQRCSDATGFLVKELPAQSTQDSYELRWTPVSSYPELTGLVSFGSASPVLYHRSNSLGASSSFTLNSEQPSAVQSNLGLSEFENAHEYYLCQPLNGSSGCLASNTVKVSLADFPLPSFWITGQGANHYQVHTEVRYKLTEAPGRDYDAQTLAAVSHSEVRFELTNANEGSPSDPVPGMVQINHQPTGLERGTYTGIITINAPDSTRSWFDLVFFQNSRTYTGYARACVRFDEGPDVCSAENSKDYYSPEPSLTIAWFDPVPAGCDITDKESLMSAACHVSCVRGAPAGEQSCDDVNVFAQINLGTPNAAIYLVAQDDQTRQLLHAGFPNSSNNIDFFSYNGPVNAALDLFNRDGDYRVEIYSTVFNGSIANPPTLRFRSALLTVGESVNRAWFTPSDSYDLADNEAIPITANFLSNVDEALFEMIRVDVEPTISTPLGFGGIGITSIDIFPFLTAGTYQLRSTDNQFLELALSPLITITDTRNNKAWFTEDSDNQDCEVATSPNGSCDRSCVFSEDGSGSGAQSCLNVDGFWQVDEQINPGDIFIYLAKQDGSSYREALTHNLVLNPNTQVREGQSSKTLNGLLRDALVSNGNDPYGEYRIELCGVDALDSVCGDEDLLALSDVLDVVEVGSEESDTPYFPDYGLVAGVFEGLDDLPPIPAGNALVGATSGQFSVSETGAATYEIPILVAQGSAGFAPSISLAYSSQAGVTELGRGWSIRGVSVISRCRQTAEQDNANIGIQLTESDRFCLNGQRLMMVVDSIYGADGVEYRTEVDSFSKIISHGISGSGPMYFTVESTDGSTTYYGQYTASRSDAFIDSLSGDGTVYEWPVAQFKDAYSNYIDYIWNYESTLENGSELATFEYHIDEIRYTGNTSANVDPYNRIVFNYSYLDEPIEGYIFGVKRLNSYRLDSIDSKARITQGSPEKFIRRYRIDYELNPFNLVDRVSSISECANDQFENDGNSSTQQICFKPIDFTWNETRNFDAPGAIGRPVNSNPHAFSGMLAGGIAVDLNADGKQDVVYLKTFTLSGTLRYEVRYGISKIEPIILNAGKFARTIVPNNTNVFRVPDPNHWYLVDVNSDGHPDIVNLLDNKWVVRKWIDEATGFEFIPSEEFCVFLEAGGCRSIIPAQLSSFSTTDVNGDGWEDLMFIYIDKMYMSIKRRDSLANGSYQFSFSTAEELIIDPNLPLPNQGENVIVPMNLGQLPDFNNDGLADVLILVDTIVDPEGVINTSCKGTVSIDRSDGSSVTGLNYCVMNEEIFDATRSHIETHARTWMALVQDINGVFTLYDTLSSHEQLIEYRSQRFTSTDVNGDGFSDLVISTKDVLDEDVSSDHFLLNTGIGFIGNRYFECDPLVDVNCIHNENDRTVYFDYDNDGDVDALFAEDTSPRRYQIIRWDKTAFLPAIPLPYFAGSEYSANIWIDVDGDGLTELLVAGEGIGQPTFETNFDIKVAVRKTFNQFFSDDILSDQNALENIIKISTDLDRDINTDDGNSIEITYRGCCVRGDNAGDFDLSTYGNGSPVFDLFGGTPVVFRVTTSAPSYDPSTDQFNSNATHGVNYRYTGARVQAGGRGFLGFEKIESFDEVNKILSTAEYHQNYPLTGLPKYTKTEHKEQWTGSGCPAFCPTILLAESFSDWLVTEKATVNGSYAGYQVVIGEKTTFQYSPVTDSDGNFLNQGSTPISKENEVYLNHNEFGNALLIEKQVFSYSGSDYQLVSEGSLINVFGYSSFHGKRLTKTQTKIEINGEQSLTQLGFDYDSKGVVEFEYVDRFDDVQNVNYHHAITTRYNRDSFGNVVGTFISGDSLLARQATTNYEPLGRYVVSNTNNFGQTISTLEQWDVFGNILIARDISGTASYFAYDELGQLYYSYEETGSESIVIVKNCSDSGALCDNEYDISWMSITTGQGLPVEKTYYDRLGRQVRVDLQSLDVNKYSRSETLFDLNNQLNYVTTPHWITNQSPMASTMQYDDLSRILNVFHADGSETQSRYYGLTTEDTIIRADVVFEDPDGNLIDQDLGPLSFENSISSQRLNVLGQTIWSIDTLGNRTDYQYSIQGELSALFGVQIAGSSRSLTTHEYNDIGQKIKSTDSDKGTLEYRYDITGQLLRQKDANNNLILYEYDSLSRLIKLWGLNNVSNIDSNLDVAKQNPEYYNEWDYDNSLSITAGNLLSERKCNKSCDTGGSILLFERINSEFDQFARLTKIDTYISNGDKTFTERANFNHLGRLKQKLDASGGNSGIQYKYTEHGYLSSIHEANNPGLVYQTINNINERGDVTMETYGNGVVTTRAYHWLTGNLQEISASKSSLDIQFQRYVFDGQRNLHLRHDQSGSKNVRERFTYDGLNRLTQVDIKLGSNMTEATYQNYSYDARGNIIYKSGLGTYDYGSNVSGYSSQCGNSANAGVHAVTKVAGDYYCYDNNGNQISRGVAGNWSRQIEYTAFDKPELIVSENDMTRFYYDTNNTRYLRVDGQNGNKKTYYVGNVEVIEEGSTIIYRRYIGNVAISEKRSSGEKVQYLHKDHLNSIDVITGESGSIIDGGELSFDPFGMRRDAIGTDNLVTAIELLFENPITEVTNRGFTGHEQLDLHDLIHMNGRIYDPILGRFVQADPITTQPLFSQSLNRYSYVYNNPLSTTDSTGFIGDDLRLFLTRIVTTLLSAYGGTFAIGTWQSVAYAAASGFVSGALITGSLRGGIQGAFSAVAWNLVSAGISGGGDKPIVNSSESQSQSELFIDATKFEANDGVAKQFEVTNTVTGETFLVSDSGSSITSQYPNSQGSSFRGLDGDGYQWYDNTLGVNWELVQDAVLTPGGLSSYSVADIRNSGIGGSELWQALRDFEHYTGQALIVGQITASAERVGFSVMRFGQRLFSLTKSGVQRFKPSKWLKFRNGGGSKKGGDNLFRVVDDIELADIKKTGVFRAVPGQAEGKQFVDNLGDAQRLQKRFLDFFGGNQSIVRGQAQQSVLDRASRTPFGDIPKGNAVTIPIKDLSKVKPIF